MPDRAIINVVPDGYEIQIVDVMGRRFFYVQYILLNKGVIEKIQSPFQLGKKDEGVVNANARAD